MSNYKLVFHEDAKGDLVDIRYYHSFCAPPNIDDWPCPEWPDYSVFCAGCGEIIHEGTVD